jgi:hypothetical protein
VSPHTNPRQRVTAPRTLDGMWMDLTVGVALGALIITCLAVLACLALSPDNE